MGLVRFALNIAVKNEKIESFNRFLFVGPHPDDIEIGAGATISKLTKLNKEVCFLICTDGRYGTENLKDDIDEQELIKIRKNESIESAKVLGVTDVRFLNLTDGDYYEIVDLKRGIASVIDDFKPDVIFSPDPDVPSECHSDHLNVGNACKEVGFFANYDKIFAKYLDKEQKEKIDVKALCFYMTAKPNKFVKTNKNIQRQFDAIDCHKSQYPVGHGATSSLKLYLKLRSIENGFKSCSFGAEGFRMMNRMRMHCLPESTKM